MRLETRKLLLDALEACHSIKKLCQGVTMQRYMAERGIKRAVEREFEISGEALNRLSRLDEETSARITALRRIVNFRNRLIHGYDTIDDEIVWGVVEEHLPLLTNQLESLVKEGEQSESGGDLPAKD